MIKKQAKLRLVYGLEINSYLIKFLINWKLGTICSNQMGLIIMLNISLIIYFCWILSLSLTWLINQIKLSRAQTFELFDDFFFFYINFLMTLSLNIVCRLGSRTFCFCCWVELEHYLTKLNLPLIWNNLQSFKTMWAV